MSRRRVSLVAGRGEGTLVVGREPRGSTLGSFFIGAVCSVASAALLRCRPPGGVERWTRESHTGRPVSLFEGPAYAVGAVAGALAGGAGAPAAVAGLGAGVLGAFDDLVGDSSSKGLRGHLAAVRRGEVTTGAIKIVGLGATGLLSAWLIDRSRIRTGPMITLLGGAVIAGSANIINLLDLRPGRALKVVLLSAVPIAVFGRGPHQPSANAAAVMLLSAAVPSTASSIPAAARSTATSMTTAGAAAGAALGCLRNDLAGRSMLGDTGANSAGAMLGTAFVARTGLRGRLLALGVLTGLTLASEKVSFTAVIESTPGLRELDALGRPSLGRHQR